MAFSVSYVYEILDRYSAPLRKINEKVKQFARKTEVARKKALEFGKELVTTRKKSASYGLAIRASQLQTYSLGRASSSSKRKLLEFGKTTDSVRRKIWDFRKTIASAQKGLTRFGRALRRAGDGMTSVGQSMVTRITLVGAAIAGFSLKASADMEQLQVSFGVMLGGMEKGKQMIQDLTDFAARTPFQLTGIGKATKRLLAFGFAQDRIMPTLNMLGDISAGTGKDLAELGVIFGQVKMAGRLMGQDFLQFVNAGVPVAEELAKILAKKFGGSIDQNKRRLKDFMSKGMISFGMVKKAMQSMTSEGGRFHKMMGLQSQTLGGLWSTLKDNFHLAVVDFGDMLVKLFNLKGGLASVIDTVKRLRVSFKAWADENPEIAKMVLVIGGLLMVLGPILLVLGPIVKLMGFLGIGLGGMTAPILIVIAAVALLVLMFKRWISTNHPIIQSLKRLWQAMEPIRNVIGFVIYLLGELMVQLFGNSKEVGDLAHFFDILGLALIPVIAAITGLLNILMFNTEGNAFAGMMDDLNEFRKGTSMVAQVYDGMVNRVSHWIENVADFFKMIGKEMANFRKLVEDLPSLTLPGAQLPAQAFAKAMDFIQGTPDVTGGEQTGKNRAEARTRPQKIDISGKIGVEGRNGSKINDATIDLNQGANLATVM